MANILGFELDLMFVRRLRDSELTGQVDLQGRSGG